MNVVSDNEGRTIVTGADPTMDACIHTIFFGNYRRRMVHSHMSMMQKIPVTCAMINERLVFEMDHHITQQAEQELREQCLLTP